MGLQESTIKESLEHLPVEYRSISQQFQEMCESAKSVDEIKAVIAKAESTIGPEHYKNGMLFKDIYNLYIGWALPTQKALNIIYKAWDIHVKKYPDARLIDVGAGTGVYCLLLQDMGVPINKLVALDIEPKTHKTCRNFFPLTIHKDDFEIHENDFLLICWGYGYDFEKYIEKVKCVVIQGEQSDGCTYPTDALIDDDSGEIKEGWKMETFKNIPSLALPYYGEQITVNTRD